MSHTKQDEEFERAMMAKLGVSLDALRKPDPALARRLSREADIWLRAKQREERELSELEKLI